MIAILLLSLLKKDITETKINTKTIKKYYITFIQIIITTIKKQKINK